MRWEHTARVRCSVARTLAIVGDRWTFLVVRDAFLRVRRFEQFQARLGISRHRLADRLARLVAHGILERVRYQERPERFEYRLTAKGRDLHGVLLAVVGWGDRWLAGAAGPPLELVHRACGEPMQTVPHCSRCGTPVGPRDVEPRPGPGLARPPRRRPSTKRPPRAARKEASV